MNAVARIGASSKLGGFSLYNSDKDYALAGSKGNSRSPEDWKASLRNVDIQVNVFKTGQVTHSFKAYQQEIKKGKTEMIF